MPGHEQFVMWSHTSTEILSIYNYRILKRRLGNRIRCQIFFFPLCIHSRFLESHPKLYLPGLFYQVFFWTGTPRLAGIAVNLLPSSCPFKISSAFAYFPNPCLFSFLSLVLRFSVWLKLSFLVLLGPWGSFLRTVKVDLVIWEPHIFINTSYFTCSLTKTPCS